MASKCKWDAYKNVRNLQGINLAFCKCLEYARGHWVQFANGMPHFQEQSTWPQGAVVYDLDIIKIKFVVVFHSVAFYYYAWLQLQYVNILFWSLLHIYTYSTKASFEYTTIESKLYLHMFS